MENYGISRCMRRQHHGEDNISLKKITSDVHVVIVYIIKTAGSQYWLTDIHDLTYILYLLQIQAGLRVRKKHGSRKLSKGS